MGYILCQICGVTIHNKFLRRHIKDKHSQIFSSKEELDKMYYDYVYGHDIIQKLIDDYSNFCSLPELRIKYNIAFKTSSNILRLYNVKIRSVKEVLNTEKTRQKKIKTTIERYGVPYNSQAESVKAKKRETFIQRYGVDNIWKTEWFKSQINNWMLDKYGIKRTYNIEKQEQTCLDRYGVKCILGLDCEELIKLKQQGIELTEEEIFGARSTVAKVRWENLPDEEKNKSLKILLSGYTSKLEQKINDILVSWQITFERNIFMPGYHYSYDFYLPDLNFIIEVQGDYWHAWPEKYKADDVFTNGSTCRKACEIWSKDEKKKNIALDNGYKIGYVWEHEVNSCKNIFELEKLVLTKLNISSLLE